LGEFGRRRGGDSQSQYGGCGQSVLHGSMLRLAGDAVQ
jgi:hypothetical protein